MRKPSKNERNINDCLGEACLNVFLNFSLLQPKLTNSNNVG